MLSFENNIHKINYERPFLPIVEVKEYNVMIDRRNFFDQLVKNDERTYVSI